MAHRISVMLRNFIQNNLDLSEEQIIIVQYCFEQLISKLLFVIFLLFFGIITKRYLISIIYLCTIIPLRTLGGGAHASTKRQCILLSYGISIFIIFFTPYISEIINKQQLIIIYFLCLIISIYFAPIDTKNKRLDTKKSNSLRGKFRVLSIILTIIYLLMCYYDIKNPVTTITIAVILFTLSLIVGIIQNRRDTYNVV